MGVDKEPVEDDSEESNANDEKDGEEVKTLKVRLLSVFVLIVIDLPLPRSDVVTSAVFCNLRTTDSVLLHNHPDTRRARRCSC